MVNLATILLQNQNAGGNGKRGVAAGPTDVNHGPTLKPTDVATFEPGRSQTRMQPHALSIPFETLLPITASQAHVQSCVAAVRVPLQKIGSLECQTITEHSFV